VAELQCSVLVKRNSCTWWMVFANVQKHVELHDIYQSLSREIARRGECFFHRIL